VPVVVDPAFQDEFIVDLAPALAAGAAAAAATMGGGRPDTRSVACARIWGVSAAAAAQVVRSRCASPAENEGGSPRRHWCGDTRVLLRWIAARPPLTLR
jgi:hypothetical protein